MCLKPAMKGLKQIQYRQHFFSMIYTTYTLPVFRLVCLLVSRMCPFKTCLGETSKRLKMQVREDNAGDKATLPCNGVWKFYCFVFGFPSLHARTSFFNYLKKGVLAIISLEIRVDLGYSKKDFSNTSIFFNEIEVCEM